MALKIYNTLTRKKEDFKPAVEGRVKMYVCGPTVYNYISIGNSRPIIIFDMVRNYLEYSGYDVFYVQNITDIEDKIINKANLEGVDYKEITKRYIDAFREDIKNLEVGAVNEMPMATEMIPEIIEIIKKIIDNGYAYVLDGDVYFDVSRFEGYGKLSGQKIDEMRDSDKSEFKKKNSIDFALWKSAKLGEPSWESPWSKGRPGWHIECSAMSQKYLGFGFDIHGGGIDLIFPHHENEIAQSEAAFVNEGQFVRFWMHNGMIEVKDRKMSKSDGLQADWILKNLLKKYSPNILKYYILSTHYRSPLEFSAEKLEEAAKAIERLTTALINIDFIIKSSNKSKKSDNSKKTSEYFKKINDKLSNEFVKFMDDDFNTAGAVGSIFEQLKNINSRIQSPEFSSDSNTALELESFSKKIKSLYKIFGIDLNSEISGDYKISDTSNEIDIEKLIKEREEARLTKDFKKSDEIRNMLLEKGIILEDRKEGTIWRRQS